MFFFQNVFETDENTPPLGSAGPHQERMNQTDFGDFKPAAQHFDFSSSMCVTPTSRRTSLSGRVSAFIILVNISDFRLDRIWISGSYQEIYHESSELMLWKWNWISRSALIFHYLDNRLVSDPSIMFVIVPCVFSGKALALDSNGRRQRWVPWTATWALRWRHLLLPENWLDKQITTCSVKLDTEHWHNTSNYYRVGSSHINRQLKSAICKAKSVVVASVTEQTI